MAKYINTLRELISTKDCLKECSTEWTAIDNAIKSIISLLVENEALRDRLNFLISNEVGEQNERT